jgi:benzoylformate decarboxylase
LAAFEADFRKEWDATPLRPSRVIKEIANTLPLSSVVVDESVMLTSYVEYIMRFSRPASYFSASGCIGWGLPASLGVALGTSRRPVVALVGDGSALFGLQALWTAAKYQIPVIMVVLDNQGYAAIKWGFSMYPDRRASQGADLGCDLGDVNFPQLAHAFGINSQHVEHPLSIAPVLKQAIKEKKPTLIDISVDPCDVGYGLPRLAKT